MGIVTATPEAIAAAAAHLRAGRLVAFATETVYGLGADATNGRAVAAIYTAKGRPRFNPLIVHVADTAAAHRIAEFAPQTERLAGAFWPGPLTLVLPRRANSGLSELVTAGLDTVALRVPDHPQARALLAAADVPVAAPSANRSGRLSATRAEHVAEDLGEAVAMILDAGPTAYGIESTILAVSGDLVTLLRPGAVPAEAIEAVIGAPLARPGFIVAAGAAGAAGEAPRPSSPGQLESHYAPRAKLRLDADDVRPGEALLAFGSAPPPVSGPVFNLSPTGDLIEAAANLFAALRMLDASGAATIAVMTIPETGLGEAIGDRLRRAAAPRP